MNLMLKIDNSVVIKSLPDGRLIFVDGSSLMTISDGVVLGMVGSHEGSNQIRIIRIRCSDYHYNCI